MHLNSSGIGDYLGTAYINNVCYTDDLCLISLSSSEMQQLLHICNKYVAEHQLLYNGSKSFSLRFKRKNLKYSSRWSIINPNGRTIQIFWKNYFH